jgi:hypothetical protein
MAGFYQHVSVSTALGVGYGAAAFFAMGMDWEACVIAGGLTSVAGMLPDLDSPNGQPVREVFGFGAAVAPLLLLKRCHCSIGSAAHAAAEGQTHLSNEKLLVLMAACYIIVRYGCAWLLDRMTDHRGMFHSIPAAAIAAGATFLLFELPSPVDRLFLAGGTLIGFLSHLVMDEIWSIRVGISGVGMKKSAGTAFKLFSKSIPATAVTYAILLGACYLLLQEPAVNELLGNVDKSEVPRVAEELIDAVRR